MSGEDNRREFDRVFAAAPLIAILRGIAPEKAAAIGEAIVSAGISIIEVPLNSARPLASIERLHSALSDRAVIGAGTVLDRTAVREVAQAGAALVLSPNTDPAVIEETKRHGLVSIPGVFTPSEAFSALAAGADALKLFPGEMMSPATVRALAAVLPTGVRLVLVGGVGIATPGLYRGSPLAGFGIGSALFQPGFDATAVADRARAFVAAFRAVGPEL